MDKNTIIGIGLIMVIWFGYMWAIKPSEEEVAAKRMQDSIAMVQQAEAEEAVRIAEQQGTTVEKISESEEAEAEAEAKADAIVRSIVSKDSTLSDSDLELLVDSVKQTQLSDKFGDFADAAKVPEGDPYVIIENEDLRLTVARQGGRMVAAELKKFHTYDSLPLLLFDEDSSQFDITFRYRNRGYHTENLFFEPDVNGFEITGTDSSALSMRLYGATRDQYIEYVYGMPGTGHMIDFDINVVGMSELVRDSRGEFVLDWNITALSKEKGVSYERDYTTVNYRSNEDYESLSERGDDEEDLEGKTQWVSFTQQFFSYAYLADDYFDKDGSDVRIATSEDPSYTKYMGAELTLPLSDGDDEFAAFGGRFFLGPNGYEDLKGYGVGLEEQVNFGPSFIAWFSKWVIVPLFNALDGTGLGYGMIILILTLLIKTLLFPITYKSFLSSARMKALKPEIDEITEKYKDKDAMEKQRATMDLYRKAGVSPTAGCIPMLLQFPILLAMYRFFPASIELRQQPFLWADDLSSYDSIFNFPNGFEIPFYGDHISLFTLLMAISTFVYTKYNMQTQAGGPQMAQMKVIAYAMPVMLLVWFNSYAAGLSYYYLTSNLISIGQHLVIKKFFINEDDIRKKIAENKKKPKKKSKFQARMENMAKDRRQIGQDPKGKGKKR